MIKKAGVFCSGLMILLVCLLCGCESDSGDNFDYGDNDPNVWVAFGDSITSGLSGEAQPYPPRLAGMTGKNVVNEGRSGEHAYEAVSRVWGILNNYKPGRLLILYGVNDIFHNQDQSDIIDDLRTIVQAAKANKTMPVIATMLPVIDRHDGIYQGTIEMVNADIRLMAAEEGVRLVDLAPLFGTGDGLQFDGLHPNAAGSEIIATAFR